MEENNNRQVNQPTYEELKNYCDQLLMQRNRVAQDLQQVSSIVNKLPWLFKVLENSHYFEEDFVLECINEITDIMTPAKEEKPKTGSENTVDTEETIKE